MVYVTCRNPISIPWRGIRAPRQPRSDVVITKDKLFFIKYMLVGLVQVK